MALDETRKTELTEKQEAFCQSYLIDFNGARAARDAGYAADSAAAEASRQLTNVNVQARINELRLQMGKAFNVTRERIAQELARIGFLDIRKCFDEMGVLKRPAEWSDDEAAGIAGLENEQIFDYDEDGNKALIGYLKKVKLADKRAALDSLSRLMGYNEPDKLLLSGVKINVIEPDE